jgi:hypothetical protein
MSHTSLRQEQTCLNCGQNVHDRFCSYCGQENREPHESFWSLLIHFVEDIFHYDGKLFTTIKQLFLKPGFLSSEYLHGKRTVYLHPIRFYLFTSAFFFISLFYVFHPLEKILKQDEVNTKKSLVSSVNVFENGFQGDKKSFPKTFEAYMQVQSKLPQTEQDSKFEQKLIKQGYSIGKQYTTSEALFESLVDTMLHKMSTLLFVALPLLAFVLQLVFLRRKGYYYMHHGIFILHIATSQFIMLFAVEILGIIQLATAIPLFGKISSGLIFAWFVYYLFAFKRFYQLTWPKAMIYYAFAVLMQQILLAFIFIGLLIFSFFSL